MAVAGDGGFYLAGRIAVDGDFVLGGGEEDYAADFGEAQGSADIEGAEDGFDCHGRGGKFANQRAEQLVDVLESSAGGFFLAFGGGPEGAVTEHYVLATIAFDDAVARRAGGGGVETQDAYVPVCGVGMIHGFVVYGEGNGDGRVLCGGSAGC